MYFLYIGPTWTEISALQAKLAEYKNISDKTIELTTKRDELIVAYNAIPAGDIAKLNKIVPETLDMVQFANDINNLALRYGLSADSFKLNPIDPNSRDGITAVPGPPPPYKTSAIVISMKGSYEQFIRFLQDTETNLQLTDVTSLSVRSSDREKNAPLQYTIEMNAYSLK
jgi:Tfp pilus assembly protein PilO